MEIARSVCIQGARPFPFLKNLSEEIYHILYREEDGSILTLLIHLPMRAKGGYRYGR